MNIVFFTHPVFYNCRSISKYTKMLSGGMIERGHHVEIWSPVATVSRISKIPSIRKWLGYIDQFIIFPNQIRRRIKSCPADTLFVFTDQALGPWVPLVSHRPHVIHCHDFLALRSALSEIEENKTRWSGRRYQSFIRKGYSRGKHFISVSYKTEEDLHRFLPVQPLTSEVVYNGFNGTFKRYDACKARNILEAKTGICLNEGYLLHVGGNQWYKNRVGVIEIYEAWRRSSASNMPLLMVGEAPDRVLAEKVRLSEYKQSIHFLENIDDEHLGICYSGASVFLFPSLAEGFGWPIAEAMASGCPVITTREAPMTEVAGNAAFFIPKRPANSTAITLWAMEAANLIDRIQSMTLEKREIMISAGIANAQRFDAEQALNRIETLYKDLLKAN